MLSLNKCFTQFRLGGWVYLRTLGKKYETEKYKEFHGTTSLWHLLQSRNTGHFAQKTFRTSLLAQVLDCSHNS